MRVIFICTLAIIFYIIVGRVVAIYGQKNGWYKHLWLIKEEMTMFFVTIFWPFALIPSLILGIWLLLEIIFVDIPKVLYSFLDDIINS